jgi:hypothetical protein
MRALLSGEHRRAVIMGAAGVAAIVALLAFRLLAGGESDPYAAVGPTSTTPVPSASVTVPTTAVPPAAPAPAVDPALLRDPFCPLVAAAAAPEASPVVCRGRTVPAGRQAVGLQDVFVEGGGRLARMHVGPVTFPNLHEGDAFSDSFRVVSLSERCGDFESAGKPFSLCEGEETFK